MVYTCQNITSSFQVIFIENAEKVTITYTKLSYLFNLAKLVSLANTYR
jgi:hypothetical protein